MKQALLVAILTLLSICMLSAGDYRIGTGTSTQQYVPVYGYSNYGWSKFFFSEDELATAGMSEATQITKIAFQVGNEVSNYIMDNQRIYMSHYYNSNYTSSTDNYPTLSAYTQVYNGTVVFNGPGWVEIELSTPFNYVGQWGLEIVWENRDGTRIAGPPYFRYTQTTGNTCVYKIGSTSFPVTDGTLYKNRPNIWFMNPPTDVPPPAEAVVPTDTATDVSIITDLVWNHTGGAPDYYKLWFGTDNPPSNLMAAQDVYGNVFDIPQYLDYNTTYYWRIVPHNDFGFAFDCPVWSFTTVPDPAIYTFPYTQDFDGDYLPDRWIEFTAPLADPMVITQYNSLWQSDDWLNVAGTDKAARINVYDTITGYLVSPFLNIANDDFVLEFDLAYMDYNTSNPISSDPNGLTGLDDRFAVLISDGFTWSSTNIVREWNNSGSPDVLNDVPNTGVHVTIPLAGLTGSKRIAFYAGSTTINADNDLMINNFVVREAVPTLGIPELLITRDDVNNLISITWNAITGANSYQVYSCSSPDGTYELIDTIPDTHYELSASPNRAFFKVVASSER